LLLRAPGNAGTRSAAEEFNDRARSGAECITNSGEADLSTELLSAGNVGVRRSRRYTPARVLPGLALVLAVAATGVSRAAADASPEGYWRTKGFVVHISRCGVAFCGELVGLTVSKRADALRLDSRNKDPSQRSRPLCGIDLLGDFRPSKGDAAKWEGGWIYNPDDGKTYSSEVRLQGANTLKARGYVLIPLLGKDITLVRENEATARCTGS
jgi:uncharacterized protein (DUF2147 family)